MARLNRNNFLVWDGSFDEIDFAVVANDDTAVGLTNDEFVQLTPLANDSATFGIDVNSFTIVSHDNPTNPPVWNSATQILTYYLPSGTVAGVKNLTYRFRDSLGNLSNLGNIAITISAAETEWVGYEPSKICLQVDDANTGEAFYTQLQEYYVGGGAVDPISLKANDDEDPDYIPPFLDETSCPLVPGVVDYTVDNNAVGGDAKIMNVSFYSLADVLIQSEDMNLFPEDSTTFEGPSGSLKVIVEIVSISGSTSGSVYVVAVNSSTSDPGTNNAFYEFISPTIGSMNTITLTLEEV